jgi:hypothetical protein
MDKKLYLALGDAGKNIIKMASSNASQYDINKDNILLVNTDKSSLKNEKDYHCLLIGEKILKGHCAGGVKFGQKAIDESISSIINYINKKQYNKILIISAAAGGTGGNAAYLSQLLLQHKMQHKLDIGICLSNTFSFETEEPKRKAKEAIKGAHHLEEQLLFLKVFNPIDLENKLPIKSNENLSEYIVRLNQYIMDKSNELFDSFDDPKTIIMNEQGENLQDFLDASKNAFSDNVDEEIKKRASKSAKKMLEDLDKIIGSN